LFLGNGGSTADTVFLNDGAGTFTNSGQSLGAASTVALAVGDLDNDGDLDVITAVGTGGQPVRAWLNNGAGTFTVGDALTVTAAQDVVLGDLDGDGDLDAVIAVLGQNEILKNDGTGTFGSAYQRFGNNDNRAAALIDLDGDGDLDIVTVKNADSERLWFNDGTGTVTESRRRGLADDSVAVVAARFDGDSDLDLIVIVDGAPHRAYFGSASGGQPDADFGGAGISTTAVAARSGAAGDIDRDGDIDVVLSGVAGGATIMENDGAGTFAVGASFGPDGATVLALVDIDCDGDLDALVRDPIAAFGVDLWLNDGAGGFTAGPTGLADPLSGFADANGDGALDFVGSDILGTPALYFGDGAGGFTDSGADLGAGPGLQAVLGRFDGDAVMDVAVLEAGTVRVALGAGDGVTDSTELVMFVTSDGLVADDFDHDGDLDLVGFAMASGRLEPYRNDLPSGFTTLALTGASRDYEGVTLYDHDEDGFLDVFTWAAAPVATTAVFVGDGSGGYSSATTGGVADLQQVLLADFDGDGDIDILAGSMNDASSASLSWYQNDGLENFTKITITTAGMTADTIRDLKVADVDSDGDLDIVTVSQVDNRIAWWNNDGSGNFTQVVISTSLVSPRAVDAMDFDGDGDIDIVAGGNGVGDTIHWLE
ncbi:MAG: VCBS repeat-containing protein, partial [Ilumatobacter sp.]|nr:VCBS repeat-containing protein [Ilumatobacter sp.]